MMDRFFLLAACLAGLTTHATKSSWERTWTVSRIICSSCSAADRVSFQKYIGTQIEIDPQRFINPADESCRKGVVYTDVHRRKTPYAYATIPGLPAISHDYVIAGTIGCAAPGGLSNTVARVVFDRGTGYYLFEGGAIFVLR